MDNNLKALDQYVLPAGKTYVDPEDENGNLTGEIYIGDSQDSVIQVANEGVQKYSNDSPLAELQEDVATRIDRNFNFAVSNVNFDNMARFFIGNASQHTQAAGPVTNHPINAGNGVLQGSYYQLGVTALRPTGARNVSAVAIKDGVPTTYVVDDDYTLDAETGRIYIVPGGAIVDGTVITSDHTLAADTILQLVSAGIAPKVGALRVVADNTRGPNRDHYFPKVQLKPSGDFSVKSRTDWQLMSFECRAQIRTGLAAMYIDGRPVSA